MARGLFLAFAHSQAPVKPARTGLLAALTSVALCSLVVNLACPNDHPLHLLLFHLLMPTVAIGVAALAVSARILRW